MDSKKTEKVALEEQRLFWSKQYGREATLEDVCEINENLHNNFSA